MSYSRQRKNRDVFITADQIEFMLLQFLPEADTDVTEYAAKIIDCFVHSVYLWDDKCVIWLNMAQNNLTDKKKRMELSVNIENETLKKT